MKKTKAISDFGVDNSKYTIISLRTVAALRKQSCGLFLAAPQELCSEDPKVKKIPKAISDFGVDNSKIYNYLFEN